MEEKKPLAYIVLVIVIVGGLGMWLFRGDNNKNDRGSAEQKQTVTKKAPPSVSLDIKLTPEEKSGDVAFKKAEILIRIKSTTPLTVAEKQEITLIMATKANIYQFSEEERKAIFAAFSR